MKCSTTPILATELVTYYPEIDLQPLRDYLHRLHSSDYTHGSLKQTKNHYLHEVDTLKPMFDKIQECLDHYKEKYDYDCDAIKTSLSWVNISSEREYHPEHTHPNSLVSGILYLNNTSPTTFVSSNVKEWGGSVFVRSYHKKHYENSAIEGQLVLFPSDLGHFTSMGIQRATLSFNTMPVGTVNTGTLMEHTY